MAALRAPMLIGPFRVQPDGTLILRDGFDAGFSWTFGSRRIRCRYIGGRVLIRVVLCRIPSTAEAPHLRHDVFAAVTALRERMPKGWRMGLLPDHGIAIEAETCLDSPPTSAQMIAENVTFAMHLRPYLEIFDELGSAPPTSRHVAPDSSRGMPAA